MKKEIKLRMLIQQKDALVFLIKRLHPDYVGTAEFIKDSIARRFNCNWSELKIKAKELGWRG